MIIRKQESCGRILLDYALSDYCDFKIGGFLYDDNSDTLINLGISTLEAKGDVQEHVNFLEEMGFEKIDDNLFRLKLHPHFISDKKF